MINTTKNNYSVQATYITTNLMPLNATLYITYIKLHTTTELPLDDKKYLYFLINKKIISGFQVCQVTHTSNICQ